MIDVEYLSWPAPLAVKACFTRRGGGVSRGAYNSFNLAGHVGDDFERVQENRHQLSALIGHSNIHWLEQVHGIHCLQVDDLHLARLDSEKNRVQAEPCCADASTTRQPGQVCSVMTADCLPVFFCDAQGQQVAVAHAGWRGLCQGVLQSTLETFDSTEVMAYLGPAISQQAFEVGAEVKQAFCQHYPHLDLARFFIAAEHSADRVSKWMADLYGIARAMLNHAGVEAIYGGDYCTYTEKDTFFSYRRDGQTGRMAHLIWLEPSPS